MSNKPKQISIKEFQDFGYLQEANRLFFHPLGLSLQITFSAEDESVAKLEAILDAREDPEGWVFGCADMKPKEIQEMQLKAARVQKEWADRSHVRELHLGFALEPITLNP